MPACSSHCPWSQWNLSGRCGAGRQRRWSASIRSEGRTRPSGAWLRGFCLSASDTPRSPGRVHPGHPSCCLSPSARQSVSRSAGCHQRRRISRSRQGTIRIARMARDWGTWNPGSPRARSRQLEPIAARCKPARSSRQAPSRHWRHTAGTQAPPKIVTASVWPSADILPINASPREVTDYFGSTHQGYCAASLFGHELASDATRIHTLRRSRKAVWLIATVGSNPTLSATASHRDVRYAAARTGPVRAAHDAVRWEGRPRGRGSQEAMPKRIPDKPTLCCPSCGADRLIPLTFPIYRREAGPMVVFRRPVAKCAGCGERIFVGVIARQPQSSELETD